MAKKKKVWKSNSGAAAFRGKEDRIREFLSTFDPRPVISIALDPQTKNSYVIQADCRKSFTQNAVGA